MYKNLIKHLSILLFSIISLNHLNCYANHLKYEDKNKEKSSLLEKNKNNIENRFNEPFDNYQSFEDSVKPSNQFKNLFGVGGFADQRLKKSSFSLWDIYEKEMSNQIGNKRLGGIDINNTFNDSINTLEK